MALTTKQLNIYTFVGENEGTTQKEIAEHMRTSVQCINKHLLKIEKKGLVRRRKDAAREEAHKSWRSVKEVFRYYTTDKTLEEQDMPIDKEETVRTCSVCGSKMRCEDGTRHITGDIKENIKKGLIRRNYDFVPYYKCTKCGEIADL